MRLPPIRKGVVEASIRLQINGGKGDPNLQSLNLGGEPICVRGFKMLAESLKHNVYLRELFLYNTDLTLPGMIAMTDALEGNEWLSSLNLGENTLCAKSVERLVQLLQKAPALNQLYLDWGVANSDVKDTIKAALQPRYRLKLWRKRYGEDATLPSQAFEYVGHHSGKFHTDKEGASAARKKKKPKKPSSKTIKSDGKGIGKGIEQP